jgi:polyhydroxybutyrate depolymerase
MMKHVMWLCVCGVACTSPSRPTTTPVLGASLGVGDHVIDVVVAGVARTYLLHVPPAVELGAAMPLLVALHGGGGSGQQLHDAVDVDEVADARGYVVAFPDGIAANWADGRGTTDAEQQGADDVGFITTLLDDVAARVPVDSNAVYITGVSNGGMMTHRMGCALSSRLAAIAPVIASMPTAIAPSCTTTPLPVLMIQGTLDPFIPMDGGDTHHQRFPNVGDGGDVLSAADTRALWRTNNACTAETTEDLAPVDDNDSTRVQRIIADGCADGGAVEHVIVTDMGHTWPPFAGVALRLTGPTSTQLNATAVVFDFFASHRRR